MFIEQSLNDYLDQLASAEPVPGGGATCALAGAAAAALVSMVCNLTIGRRRYREVEDELARVLQASEGHRARLQSLLQQDTEVYTSVMAAFRLPRQTESERALREQAWQAALAEAAAVPMEIARQCLAVVELAVLAGRLGNPWAVSDAGTAALLAESAARAAGLSVEINLRSMTNANQVAALRGELTATLENAQARCAETLHVVQERMGASA
ncbi:MAG: cyclodeaminase/cyclohydrolase family protein [Anaerolineae bacterium]|nr:cyclodeaminase/cyclohydrolase family protein [Chloroflexota bacterium]